MKILFLAANPVDVVSRLRIDQELREIKKRIEGSSFGYRIDLVSELAVRPCDLQAALLKHQPDIVHFSGHCTSTSGIVLEDDQGFSKAVSRKALAELFGILKGNIRVVVLNACYAKEQAQALLDSVDCAICMNDEIEDKAAHIFAGHFYQSLAFGCSVEQAFELARNQFEIEGIDRVHIPELLIRDGALISEIRLIEEQSLVDSRSTGGAHVFPRPSSLVGVEQSSRLSLYANNSKTINVRRAKQFAVPETLTRTLSFWFLANASLVLLADVVRRFLSSHISWPNVVVMIIEGICLVFAAVCLLFLVTILLRLSHPLIDRILSLVTFTRLGKSRRVTFVAGISLIIALGIWLSLPLIAKHYLERGKILQYRDPTNLSLASESYRQALSLNPSYAQAHYYLASIQESFQPNEAIEQYALAIRYDPSLYEAYSSLTRLYLLRGKNRDYENALDILSQAVEITPQTADLQYPLNMNLGWANFSLKRYVDAEIYLRKAISLRNNQCAGAHCLLAFVLKAQGKVGVADECYSCVKAVSGQTDVESNWVSDAKDYLIKREKRGDGHP